MRKLHFAGLVLLLVAAGCTTKEDPEDNRNALRAADAEWSSATGNLDSFLAYFAPDAMLMPPNEPAVTGSDNIRAWGSTMIGTPGFSISWEATSVDVAASGDLGYTAGTYTIRAQGPGGEPVNDNGKYVTVWKKDTAGAWKVVHDIFNSDLPMTAAAAPADTTAVPKP